MGAADHCHRFCAHMAFQCLQTWQTENLADIQNAADRLCCHHSSSQYPHHSSETLDLSEHRFRPLRPAVDHQPGHDQGRNAIETVHALCPPGRCGAGFEWSIYTGVFLLMRQMFDLTMIQATNTILLTSRVSLIK